MPGCLFGAIPLDNNIWQALPIRPEAPRYTAELMILQSVGILDFNGIVTDSTVFFAIAQRVPISFFNHILNTMGVCEM